MAKWDCMVDCIGYYFIISNLRGVKVEHILDYTNSVSSFCYNWDCNYLAISRHYITIIVGELL